MFVEDTAAYLADFGVTASSSASVGAWSLDSTEPALDSGSATLDGFGGSVLYEGLVIFDEPDQSILGDRGESTDYTITYRTQDFPSLAFGSAITVDSQPFTVQNAMKIGDGVFARARLAQ